VELQAEEFIQEKKSKRDEMNKIYIAIITLGLLLLSGCVQTLPEKECNTYIDCACGVHKTTGECFYGNYKYVDISQQCSDFCTGISGNLRVQCINGECIQKLIQ